MPKIEYSYIKVGENEIPYVHRDISWLDFNFRVLQEAKNDQAPLFERIKFLAIYSNNLDEFFRVRVANNRNLIRVSKKTKRKLEFDPNKIQKQIIRIVNQQQVLFSSIFESQIIPKCAENNIFIVRPTDLKKNHIQYIDEYFNDYMLPLIQPIYLKENKIKPFLNNRALYLIVHLQDKENSNAAPEYALVRIPSIELPRFIPLPSQNKKKYIMMLDDVVRSRISYFFPGYHIVESYSMKLSRDAELYIDDEYSGNLIAKIKKNLNKRNVGPASRLVYDRKMPKTMLNFMVQTLGVSDMDLFKEGRYHNNFDFFNFPFLADSHLRNKPLKPLTYRKLEKAENIFAEIKKKDHLIHVPYHTYKSVIKLFEDAATDDKVTHIKVVQYRVAKESKIMNALILAAERGKHVSVFVEVKARFDEAMNLQWGERLLQHGIHVQYSFPGLKVHSKVALIQRNENQIAVNYCYLSTGNFHEKTVKIYSDIGLFTIHKQITDDVVHLFKALEIGNIKNYKFQKLLVGKFNLRASLERLIAFEIKQAKKGKKAEIFLKMNSLQDKRIIRMLYQASQAQVRIRLIVRGICCLIPGIKGVSDNIKAISIVDRYLEHTRLYYFHHAGKQMLYSGSADLMERNLSRRIETLFPIIDKGIKAELRDFMDIQWNDNKKARIIHAKKNNTFRAGKPVMNIQSQPEMYHYYKRKEVKHK